MTLFLACQHNGQIQCEIVEWEIIEKYEELNFIVPNLGDGSMELQTCFKIHIVGTSGLYSHYLFHVEYPWIVSASDDLHIRIISQLYFGTHRSQSFIM